MGPLRAPAGASSLATSAHKTLDFRALLAQIGFLHLLAAIELFATRGYQAIGLRDLAGYLGLHAGSLYHHIESKQCLLFELIESALSDLLVDTKRRMRGARTPSERLRRFVQAFVAFNLNAKHRLILVNREFVNLNEEHDLARAD